MEDIDNWKHYIWYTETDKGNFFFTVMGEWTQEEAEEKMRFATSNVGLKILKITPRERAPSNIIMHATILQDTETKSEYGFQLLAGEGIWRALGRLVEYHA